MSIASRITAIEEHIRDIYDTIDYSYDTTGVDKNIINIPQNIFNGYINVLNDNGQSLWNALEKVSQADVTEAELSNVETAPIKMVLNGNTSQDTTSGIQLFDISKVVTNWNDGKGVKNNNDGTLTVHPPTTSSSTSASSPNTLKDYCPTLQVGDVVYLNATTTGTSKYIYLLTSASVWAFKSARTITQNDLDSRVLWYASGNDTEATISDIIISKTNTTIWEKYTGGQPSPNPDYPQQVKVVKGENVVSVSGKNLLDISYLVKSNADDKTYAAYGFWAFKLTDVVGTYTLSRANADMVAGGSHIAWGEGNDITTAYNRKTWLAHQSIAKLNDKSQIKTNSGELWLFLSTNEARIQNIPNDYGYLMLEQGSTATPYVPYSKTDYPIDLVGENLFDKDDARILRGYVYVSDKSIKTSNSDYSVIVKVKPSTKYIVTKMANNPERQAKFRLGTTTNYPQMGGTRDNVCNQVISNDTATELSITTESNDNYLVIFCYNLNSTTTLNEMLGSLVVREAEPIYKEMCTEDYFYKENDKWYIHKGFGKVTDESGSTSITISNMVSDAKIYSYYGGTVNENTITYDSAISGTNYIYYPLKTPIIEEITNTTLIEQLEAIFKAKSVADKTYITQTNDELPFILDVEAIKEYTIS